MTLTKTDEQFLTVLRAVLHGELPPVLPDAEDYPSFFYLAKKQKMTTVLLEAMCQAGMEACPAELLQQQKKRVISHTAQNIAQTMDLRRICRKLQDSGFHPIVVKGPLCAALYPPRAYRVSWDSDILVPEEEFQGCRDLLLSDGYQLKTTDDDHSDERKSYEILLQTDDGIGSVELHRSFFDTEDAALNDLFRDAFDSACEIDSYPTLSPHLHLLYLLMHSYKHFFHSGIGLRQVCDIGLWIRTYSEQIDWDLLYEQCASVRAETFVGGIFRIADERLGLFAVPKRWNDTLPDEMPLLLDMLDSGLNGSANLTRQHTASVTLNAVRAQIQAEKGKNGKAAGSFLKTFFPRRSRLISEYPYLKKYPFLLPIAWITRLFRYLCETRKTRENSMTGSVRLAKQRLDLFRFYHILR